MGLSEPREGSDDRAVVDQVIADLVERKAEGMRRYGVPLTPHNGYDGRREGYYEALDLVIYFRQYLMEDADYKAMYEAVVAQLHEAELDRDAALSELGKAEEHRERWRAEAHEQAGHAHRRIDQYDRLTLALAYVWGDARKNRFIDRIEASSPFVFEDLKASRLARKNLDAILGSLSEVDETSSDESTAAYEKAKQQFLRLRAGTAAPADSVPGVADPGVIDGDVLADILADMTPQEWRMDAARGFAEKILAEMHRVGYTVLRGCESKPWTPPQVAA